VLLGGVLACSKATSAPPAAGAAPASATFPRLVSTDELARWQSERRVVVLDVRTDVFTYLKGHLPAGAYRELFGRLGIAFDQPVVIYSAGETHNIDATFVAWLLAGFGHPQVYVLDGGFFKWQLEQRPVVQPYPRLPPTSFPDRSFRPESASLADVQAAMRNGGLLVDARPPDQYAGEAGSQMRHGHIPGAINHYWQDDLTQEGFGHVWKSADELRRAYSAQGILPERDIIAYCNSATEASHVFFTLRYLLGYPRVRIYVGSWTEWAENASLPVESGR
jgi:thiosulfate/3-mercaptopyruvate sulfurtransferase